MRLKGGVAAPTSFDHRARIGCNAHGNTADLAAREGEAQGPNGHRAGPCGSRVAQHAVLHELAFFEQLAKRAKLADRVGAANYASFGGPRCTP